MDFIYIREQNLDLNRPTREVACVSSVWLLGGASVCCTNDVLLQERVDIKDMSCDVVDVDWTL